MQTLDLIYVTTGRHPETEKIIREATKSSYAHAAAAITIEGKKYICEAVRPAVRLVSADAFNGSQAIQVIQLPITEEQRQAVVEKIFSMVGREYGIDDCVISGVRDILGEKAAELIDRVVGNESTIQCSGLQVELVRAAFPDFAADVQADYFTPESARQQAIAFAEKLGVAV